MTTFEEILPATKTSRHNGIHWTPDTGRLVVNTGRARAEYHVREFPARGGRGFRLVKLAGGTDGAADGYDVFCHDPAIPGYDSCECKGYLRFGHCKHLEAVKAILENAFLWQQGAPEQTGFTTPAPAPKSALTKCDREQDAAFRM